MARFKALQDLHHGKRYAKGDVVETTNEQAAEAVARGWLEPVEGERPPGKPPKSSKLENPKGRSSNVVKGK